MAKNRFEKQKTEPLRERFDNINNISLNYYKQNTMKELKIFEPLTISSSIKKIDKEKFEYLEKCSESVNTTLCRNNLILNGGRPVPLSNIYAAVLRYVYTLERAEHVKDPIAAENDAEWQLLIALSTDMQLNYYNLYLQKQSEGLSVEDIKKYFVKYYGFYSYKLLYMEMQAYELRTKIAIEKEELNQSKTK